MGRAALTVSTLIADKATGGKATAYLGAQNSTLLMVPGGNLAQQIASVATNGKSNDTLNKFVPDPKTMAMNDVKSVGTTLVKNPSQTANKIKSVARSNVATIHSNPVVHTLAQSAAANPSIQAVKPSIHSMMSSPAISTIARPIGNIAPKPSLISHIMPAVAIHDIPKPSTLTAKLTAAVTSVVPAVSHTLEKRKKSR